MCGIVAQRNRAMPIDRKNFDLMVDSLRHRGPDGRGTKLLQDSYVALGHRRLAIIDLSKRATQPMSNEDGRIWVSYNGEIYNYQSLRGVLKKRGHQFCSESDTEIIVHAYEEWGFECLEKFRGMFAFVLGHEMGHIATGYRDIDFDDPLLFETREERDLRWACPQLKDSSFR